MTSQEFSFPDIYNFPPFFTVQPVLNSRKKQSQLWCKLILDYCQFYKIYEMDIHEAYTKSPLFNNEKINRRLSKDDIILFMEDLVEQGNAVWLKKDKSRIKIIWRTNDQWADIIYKYIVDNGLVGQICSIYELREKDDVKNEDALKVLENRGIAKVFKGSTEDSLSVKFFG